MAVTVASGSYTIKRGGHVLTRLNDTTLACIMHKQTGVTATEQIEVYRSTNNGASWSTYASWTPKYSDGYQMAPSMCQDSTGTMRAVWYEIDPTGGLPAAITLVYASFDLAGNIGSRTDAASLNVRTADFYTDCAIADDRLQVVFEHHTQSGLGHLIFQLRAQAIIDYNGSAWSAISNYWSAQTDYGKYPSIVILGGANKYPVVILHVYEVLNDYVVHGYLGNTVNPASGGFTANYSLSSSLTPDFSTGTFDYYGPTVVQAADGEVYVIGRGHVSVGTVKGLYAIRHAPSAAWSSWKTPTQIVTTTTAHGVSAMSRAYGKIQGDINIVYAGDDIEASFSVRSQHNYNRFNSTSLYTDRGTVSTTSIAEPTYCKVRYANFWEPSLHIVDYVYEYNGTIYYDRIDLNRGV